MVTWAGRLSREKGVDVLLSGWAHLVKQQEAGLLVLLGDGPQRRELETMVHKLDLDGQVSFIGRVPNVADYLRVSDVFVLPSFNEGLSNALIEAMAAGLAVVASETSGSVDILKHGHNGLLFPCGDPQALAGNLALMLHSPTLRQRLGQAARRTVERNFELGHITDQYLALYRTLLDSRRK